MAFLQLFCRQIRKHSQIIIESVEKKAHPIVVKRKELYTKLRVCYFGTKIEVAGTERGGGGGGRRNRFLNYRRGDNNEKKILHFKFCFCFTLLKTISSQASVLRFPLLSLFICRSPPPLPLNARKKVRKIKEN